MSSYLMYWAYARLIAALGQPPPSPSSGTSKPIRIGTRNSKLALVQAEIVRDVLAASYPSLSFEICGMTTTGDKNQKIPLHMMGAKSLWTKELEVLLFNGELDLVVNCLKDMPTQLPPGAKIGAIFDREDPRDAVVMRAGSPYKCLAELPQGSVVGTSSIRRIAQIQRRHPDLDIYDVRGNVGTRLGKLDAPVQEDGKYTYECLILAAAGLDRLGLSSRITEFLSAPSVLYAVGQGALAIEIREGDSRVENMVKKLENKETMLECLAERSLMRTLEGGCSVPIGVQCDWVAEGQLKMQAIVVSVDGKDCVEAEQQWEVVSEERADEFGREMARRLVAGGAGNILEKILLNRDIVDA